MRPKTFRLLTSPTASTYAFPFSKPRRLRSRTMTPTLLAFLGSSAMQSHADTVQPTVSECKTTPSPLSGNIALASQYVSRGFRQTWGKPALQGGLDYMGSNGFSVGTWMSNVSDRYIEGATVEWDLYGNYNGKIGDATYSVGYYHYVYPGAQEESTGTRYDFSEVALDLNYKDVYLKYNIVVSESFFGIENSRGTGYLEVGTNTDLMKDLTLNLHVGQGHVVNNGMWDWYDYKVGISKVLEPGLVLSLAYTKAYGKTDVYDHYTLGIPNANGTYETSNPTTGTFALILTHTF